MLELQNFFVLGKISGTFSGKIFAFWKIFFWGGAPGMEGAPNFGITPPQPETGWHGPAYVFVSNKSSQ
jgi:hypothetical protein